MNLLRPLWAAIALPKPFDADTERCFLRNYSLSSINQRRAAIIIGLCVHLIFFADDGFHTTYHTFYNKIFYPRLTGLLIIIVFTVLLYQPVARTSEAFASFCGFCSFLATYLMMLVLTWKVPFSENYYYYQNSMLLILLFLFGVSRLLAKPTLILVCVLMAATLFTFNANRGLDLSRAEPVRLQEQRSNLNLISLFAVLGCIISLEKERTARQAFMREQDSQRHAAELIALKEQQNRDKSLFFARAAHDLRNAIQPVGNLLEASRLAFTRGDNLETQEYLNNAGLAEKALRTTVNRMLDRAELESGIIKIHYSCFDVRLLADEVIRHNKSIADKQNVTLHLLKNRSTNAIVRSDRHHLYRILDNLVNNGIKYADLTRGKTATVAIGIVCFEKTVRIVVSDNGIGIPLNEQENVFNDLEQLNNPERDRDKGLGLGLSIVKSTLNSLTNHTLKLTSKPEVGTKFILRVPKGETVDPDKPELIVASNLSLKGLYILLVENDLLVKKSITALMKANGARYEAVSSVNELQDLLTTLERDPDIVVTDYRLPDNCTAVNVLMTIKSEFGYDIPALIITGETTDLGLLTELQGKKILQKPVESKQLLSEINYLCRHEGELHSQ